MKTKITIEYLLNTSPKIIYNHISTPWGLSEWFADNVHVRDSHYVFVWDGAEQEAAIVSKKEDDFIRFKWIDDEEEDTFFEFTITKDNMTNNIALHITDFADSADEVEDLKNLWDSQVKVLMKVLGLI
jgi:uncharacterized protein YndB with AHSA1/START domain